MFPVSSVSWGGLTCKAFLAAFKCVITQYLDPPVNGSSVVWPGDQSRPFDARVAGLTSVPCRRPAAVDQSSEIAEPAEVQRRNHLLRLFSV